MLNTMPSTVLRFHSIPVGELPPPAPRTLFGRDEPVEKVVGLAENQVPTMASSRWSRWDGFIQTLNLAKDTCGVPPAQVVFGSTSTLLTTIRVCFPYSAKTNS